VATVRKLLKLLVDAAVIQSCRGNRGGYKLSQPAERTSVADVIQAIDGPIRLTKCIHDKTQNTCLIKASCPIKRQWCDLNEQIVRLLEAVSIRELAADK
jgi:Rrf2 family protein